MRIKDINAIFTNKQNKIKKKKNRNKVKRIIRNENVVLDTFPKRSVRKGLDEEIWPPRGFFAVLLTLANLHPDKNIPLSLVTRL